MRVRAPLELALSTHHLRIALHRLVLGHTRPFVDVRRRSREFRRGLLSVRAWFVLRHRCRLVASRSAQFVAFCGARRGVCPSRVLVVAGACTVGLLRRSQTRLVQLIAALPVRAFAPRLGAAAVRRGRSLSNHGEKLLPFLSSTAARRQGDHCPGERRGREKRARAAFSPRARAVRRACVPHVHGAPFP